MPATWVLVAIATLLFVHILFVALAIHRAGGYAVLRTATAAVDGPESADDGVEGHNDSTVQCQHCGVVNRAEYRYCRECASELPTGASLSGGLPGDRSRRTI